MSVVSFVDSLAALVVSGVITQYSYPPLQIATSDLPASFVRPPQSQYDPISVCSDVEDRMTCDFVVAIEPTGQNLQITNYSTLLTMIDAMNDTLKNTDLGAMVTWSIIAQDTQPIIVGGTPYWGITAKITKRG